MALNSIYCVKLFQTIYSQNVLNVFWYQETAAGTDSGATALFTAFDTDVLNTLVTTMINQLDIINLEIFAPLTPTDFADGVPSNNQGTRTFVAGERMSSYAAFGLRSNRAGPGTRSSFKRFAGLEEKDSDANSLQPAFLTLVGVQNLPQKMSDVINATPTGAEFTPVQVKTPVPLFTAPIKNFNITAWGTPYLTSQVSRRAPAGT